MRRERGREVVEREGERVGEEDGKGACVSEKNVGEDKREGE